MEYSRLLDATEYKEEHRAKMIAWGEEQRRRDPSYFCCLAIESASSNHRVWIISDARRRTDVKFFKETFPRQTLTVRVFAEESVRAARGFVFTKGLFEIGSHNFYIDHTLTRAANSPRFVLKLPFNYFLIIKSTFWKKNYIEITGVSCQRKRMLANIDSSALLD